MIWTTLLLVVGFAGRFQPGFIDHSTRPVGGPSGRSAGTDRVRRHLGCGRLAVEDCPPNHRPAVLARSVGTVLPGWVGFERDRAGWCAGVAPNLQLSPAGSCGKGSCRWNEGALPVFGVRLERVDVAPDGGVDGGGRFSGKGSIGPGRVEVAPPRDQNTGACGPSTGESFRESRMRFAGGRGPSAVALGACVQNGFDRNGPSYSGTSLEDRIDPLLESTSRWNVNVAAAAGRSSMVEVRAVVTLEMG